jgi:hypothetical protein
MLEKLEVSTRRMDLKINVGEGNVDFDCGLRAVSFNST